LAFIKIDIIRGKRQVITEDNKVQGKEFEHLTIMPHRGTLTRGLKPH
jgi:hypothetical protein